MKLIQTQDYLLLIDEEAEIKVGDYFLNPNFTLRECDNLNVTRYGNIQDKHKHSWKLSMCKGKVIGYYPLKKESKELDLPFLPSIHNKENDIEEILNKYPYNDFTFREKSGFKVGYRLAQAKQFTLDNVKKAIEMAREEYTWTNQGREGSTEWYYSKEQIIQSLSTQQLPKEFIPEFIDNGEEDWIGDDINGEPFWNEKLELKTIINSEGKEELVGTYKY